MSGTPEGAAYLTGSIKALRQGDIEAIHRTHAGLKQRAEQLDAEAQAQKVRNPSTANTQYLPVIDAQTEANFADLPGRGL
jgi:hypothetical protein